MICENKSFSIFSFKIGLCSEFKTFISSKYFLNSKSSFGVVDTVGVIDTTCGIDFFLIVFISSSFLTKAFCFLIKADELLKVFFASS